MAVNRTLSNLKLQVGDVISSGIELQTRGGTAANLSLEIVFLDISDVVLVTDGVHTGNAVLVNDSVDASGPWYRSVINNLTIPTGAVKINVGFSYDSLSVSTVTVASQRPVINRGSKVAPFIRPSNDAADGGSGITTITDGLGISSTVISLTEVSIALSNPTFIGAEPGSPADGYIWFDTINDPVFLAADVDTDTTNFNNNLSAADTTVQLALETLDDLAAGGGDADTLGTLSLSSSGDRYGVIPFSDGSGDMSIGRGLEFHGGDGSTDTYDFKVQVTGITDPDLQFRRDNGNVVMTLSNAGDVTLLGDIEIATSMQIRLRGAASDYIASSGVGDIGIYGAGLLRLNVLDSGVTENLGTSTGVTSQSVLEFQQSDGTRDGYVGAGSASNRNIQVYSDAAGVELYNVGVLKLNTTVDGITITGDLTVTGSISGTFDAATLDGLDSLDFVRNLSLISGSTAVASFGSIEGISIVTNTTGSTGFPAATGMSVHVSSGVGDISSSYFRDFSFWNGTPGLHVQRYNSTTGVPLGFELLRTDGNFVANTDYAPIVGADFDDIVTVTAGGNVSNLQDDRLSLRGNQLIYASTTHTALRSQSAVDVSLQLQTNGADVRGYVWANSSNQIGFKDDGGSWRLLLDDNGDSRIYGPTTGVANQVWLGFHESTGQREGFIGLGSALNNNLQIVSDTAGVELQNVGVKKLGTKIAGVDIFGDIDITGNITAANLDTREHFVQDADPGGSDGDVWFDTDANAVLDAGDITTGTMAVARGGTGVTTKTGTGNVVLSASPTLTGIPLSTAITILSGEPHGKKTYTTTSGAPTGGADGDMVYVY